MTLMATALAAMVDDEEDTPVGGKSPLDILRERKQDKVMSDLLSVMSMKQRESSPTINVTVPEIKLPAVVVPQAQVIVQAAPRCVWSFEFEHNRDGSIKRITATPKESA